MRRHTDEAVEREEEEEEEEEEREGVKERGSREGSSIGYFRGQDNYEHVKHKSWETRECLCRYDDVRQKRRGYCESQRRGGEARILRRGGGGKGGTRKRGQIWE